MKNYTQFNAVFAVLLAVGVASGCGDVNPVFSGPESDGTGKAEFAISESFDAGASYYSIRLYQTVPNSLFDSAYFDSGCQAPSRGFTIDHLAVGDGYVLVYEAYSDNVCSSRTGLGVRGQISITSEGTGDAYYYVQVNQVGALTQFPVPGPGLDTTDLTCKSDEDCRELVPCVAETGCRFEVWVECEVGETCTDGVKLMQYKVHPRARCINKTCRLTSLFPLNMPNGRAFAATASTSTGEVLTLGGVNDNASQRLVMTRSIDDENDPETVLFSSSDSLFDTIELGRDLGDAVALSAVAMLDDRRMVVVGGTRAMSLALYGEISVPNPSPEACPEGDCVMALSPFIYVIDISSGAVTRSGVSFSTADSLVEVVGGSDGVPRIFIRSGLYQPDLNQVVPGTGAWLCDVDDEGAVKCEDVTVDNDLVGRHGAAGACITKTGDLCSAYLIMGGNALGTPFAELYTFSGNSIHTLEQIGAIPDSMFGAKAFAIAGKAYTVGGGSAVGIADLSPFKFQVDSGNYTIIGSQMSVTLESRPYLLRAFHQATVLADGANVLVTGGIGESLNPLATAVLLTVDGSKLVIGEIIRTEDMAIADGAEARVGHSATLIRGGLLGGSVLISGGLSNVDAVPTFADGAEIFVP